MTESGLVLERLGRLHPKQIDLSLDRIRALLHDLGDPHLSLKNVIHVAGTNGKGSTVAFLKSFLTEIGYGVDVYTSPHLVDFNERISLNGKNIPDDVLVRHLLRVEEVNRGRPITFFESTTAAAFLAFLENKADYVLLETGLGGRLDATNVVETPLMCLITSLSMDHEEYLGHSLREIAAEKAGIFKTGRPVLAMKSPDEALDVLRQKAEEKGCGITIEGADWTVRPSENGFYYGDTFFEAPFLLGRHQFHNAALAISAVRCLFPETPDEVFRQGMKKVRWKGRLEKLASPELKDRFELWVDGGHNPGAGEVLADFLPSWSDKPLHVICGMLQNKDIGGFLGKIAPFITTFQAVPVPTGTAPTCPPDVLVQKAAELGIKTSGTARTPDEAIKKLSEDKIACGRILVCGSLYLLGSFLKTRMDK